MFATKRPMTIKASPQSRTQAPRARTATPRIYKAVETHGTETGYSKNKNAATARFDEAVSINDIVNEYKQNDDEFNLPIDRELNQLLKIDEPTSATFSIGSITPSGYLTPEFDHYYVSNANALQSRPT